MSKFCLSVASNCFVIFGRLEEELMLLGGSLITKGGLENQHIFRMKSLVLHTKYIEACNPYGPGSLIKESAVI